MSGPELFAEGRLTTERQPTAQDIRALVDFLPRLYGERAPPPITEWITKTNDGALVGPWPKYHQTVEDFIELIRTQDCLMDFGYDPEASVGLFMDEAAVENATIPQMRRILTALERVKRFCDGWWSSMIEDGHVQRLLVRLAKCAEDG